MAKTQDKDDSEQGATVMAVEPPPISRGGRSSQVLPQTVTSMIETIQSGSYATVTDKDGNQMKFVANPNTDKGHAAAKQRANTVAMRHKKAIVNDPDSPYDDPKQLQTRVWPLDEITYTFAVGEKPTADGEEDSE